VSEWLDDAIHVVRHGADLYVEQVGPSDAPAVLYLHGGPGASSHAFRALLGEDLERYRMIYLDQRGGGRSYADLDFDLDTLADDVVAVAAALSIPSLTLLAHGFGATVAVRCQRLHPNLVRGAVWINPWLSLPLLAGSLARKAAEMSGDNALLEESGDPNATVDAAFRAVGAKPLLDALLFPDPAARLHLEHAESSVLLGPSESAALRDLWSQDVSEELSQLRGPLTILLSSEDRSCVPDQAEVALTRLPHALTAFMPGGHHPYVEDPLALLELLVPALAHTGAAVTDPR
jgi:proline iminopeptidase